MNADERNLISSLFERVRAAEGAYRDPEAEAFIADQVARQPHAPYAMAQTLVVQNQALEAAKAKIDQLESQLKDAEERAADLGRRQEPSPWGPRANEAMGAPGGFAPREGGFGSREGSFGSGGGLFGRRDYEPSQPYGAPPPPPPSQPYGSPQQSSGGGFLSGALQTAAGVAGGALLFEGVRHLFGGGEAQASPLGEAAKLGDVGSTGGDAASPAEAGGGWFSGLLDGVGGGQADAPQRDDVAGNDDADASDDDGDWI